MESITGQCPELTKKEIPKIGTEGYDGALATYSAQDGIYSCFKKWKNSVFH